MTRGLSRLTAIGSRAQLAAVGRNVRINSTARGIGIRDYEPTGATRRQ